jgi:hypothetical protein
MRVQAGFSLVALAFFSFPAASGGQRPGAPGLREAERQMNQPLEPPLEPRAQATSPEKLRLEASELAQLSAELPAQLAQVSRGRLPKDLTDKLKHIEKLAKQLRSELSR